MPFNKKDQIIMTIVLNINQSFMTFIKHLYIYLSMNEWNEYIVKSCFWKLIVLCV